MNEVSHINGLWSQIKSVLTPYIDADYVYLDLPYHANIGDALIWYGTECWLKTIPFSCKLRASCSTFSFPKLSSKTIILMHGGGNFGDIWRQHQEFRLKVIKHYPNNRIIILPQTVFYSNPKIAMRDAAIMRQHRNVIICARDMRSLKFLKAFRFSKNLLLLPDMVFCAQFESPQSTKDALFIKRTDKEWKDVPLEQLPSDIEIGDWCSIERPDKVVESFSLIENRDEKDSYAINVFLPHLVDLGIEQLGSYRDIYTTRLHAALLGILLGKNIVLFDNSYGKNSSFYDTWLREIPNVKMASQNSIVSFKRIGSLVKNWLLTQRMYLFHA